MCRKKGIQATAIAILALTGCAPAAPPPSGPPASFLEVLQRSAFLPGEALLDLRRPPLIGGRPTYSTPSRLLPGRGWSFAEPEGTWSLGAISELFLVLDRDPGPRDLVFECQAFPAPGEQQTISITINGSSVADVTLARRGFKEYRVPIPDRELHRGKNHIELSYDYNLSPSELGINDDRRKLGARFSRIELPKRGRSLPDIGPAFEDGSIIVGHPGTLITPLRFAGGAATLTLEVEPEIRVFHGPWPDQALQRPSLGGSFELATLPGEVGCLVVEVDPQSRGRTTVAAADLVAGDLSPADAAASDRPVLAPGNAPADVATRTRATGAEPRRELSRPDVVVVLLDAARPDHFGCYGYSRDTTPRIDRLAGESLIFRNGFAEASYTRASAPTMFSGLSIADHRVLKREDRLDERATTLAEYLKAAGYRTVCYSGNPHNSIQSGLDQGCDEFEEFWRVDGGLQVEVDPLRISTRAIEVLGSGDDRPLFMMLHYVPPHEPYFPTQLYDVFSESGGTADVDGSVQTLRAINNGELELTVERRRAIEALYDGNLLKADAALGLVLDALMARERWKDTLVLIVSDHGEAFGEHGKMGHGATVYDEMLRVPFILRLPAGEILPGVNLDRLASLADIVPTILGRIGLEPDRNVSGIDLLGPVVRQGRSIIAVSDRGDHAYRTAQWKAIIGSSPDRRRLFDLTADPGESNNLIFEHLEQFFCISRHVEQVVSREAGLPSGTRAEALSPEDLKALRSLGYVD